MPILPAPSGANSFDPGDMSVPTSSAKNELQNVDPDTYGAGSSGSVDFLPTSISPVYFPYASNFILSQKLQSVAGGSTIDIPFAPMIVLADAALGALTLNLPSARFYTGKTVTIMRYDNTANTVTITAAEGTIRTTAAVGSILATQYGVIDYTASLSVDPSGGADDVLWIGR